MPWPVEVVYDPSSHVMLFSSAQCSVSFPIAHFPILRTTFARARIKENAPKLHVAGKVVSTECVNIIRNEQVLSSSQKLDLID